MRQHRFAKQFRLLLAIVAPNLQHDGGAAGGAIIFQAANAFLGRARDGASFFQDFVGHGARRRFASAFFHGVGDRLDLGEAQTRALQQHVGCAFDVLHFVGQIHGRHFARALSSLLGILGNAAHDHRSQFQ